MNGFPNHDNPPLFVAFDETWSREQGGSETLEKLSRQCRAVGIALVPLDDVDITKDGRRLPRSVFHAVAAERDSFQKRSRNAAVTALGEEIRGYDD